MTNEAKDMPFVFERQRINVANLFFFAITIAVTAFGWGITYNSMTNANAAAKEDISALTLDVKTIQTQLPSISFQLSRAADQIVENKATADTNNDATNERIDRLVESFGGKIDLLTDSVNKLVTRVEVLSTRLGPNPEPRRTNFTK